MSQTNRENFSFAVRMFRASASLFKLSLSLAKREITVKQFILDIEFRFISQSKILNDDFDWERYPNYYREELKSISKVHTLLIKDKNFEFTNGILVKRDLTLKDLHPNHEVLYSAVIRLKPNSVLEVGCGGGDHLANINQLAADISLFGIDRAEAQLNTFKERHPQLLCNTKVFDITQKECNLQSADLVFTQAVLMHISEKDQRFQSALSNIFFAANNFVVLVENWTQHDFYTEIKSIQASNSNWSKSLLYFIKSNGNPYSSALIVSKNELSGLSQLISYDQLLAGRKLLVH